jgi:hypothetical protein
VNTWVRNSGGHQTPRVNASTVFTTTFPSTESPVSQSGAFTHGYQNVGIDATGPDSTGGSPGISYAHAVDRQDYIALLQNRFTNNKHYSQVKINLVGGYTAPTSHEIEVHVGTTIGVGTAVGYEFDIWFAGTTLQAIRWDSPNLFDTGACTVVSGTWPGAVADGDVVRVDFDSTSGSPIMTVKLNGSTVITYTDVTAGKHMTGNPGFAFFCDNGIAGVDPVKYCIKGYEAGNLP